MYHCHGWIRIQIDIRNIEHNDPESDEFDKIYFKKLDDYTTKILAELKRVQENTSLLQYTYLYQNPNWRLPPHIFRQEP